MKTQKKIKFIIVLIIIMIPSFLLYSLYLSKYTIEHNEEYSVILDGININKRSMHIYNDTLVRDSIINLEEELVVKNKNKLKLINSTIRFTNLTHNGGGIIVEANETDYATIILENSKTISDNQFKYFFKVYGRIIANNSEFSSIGWEYGVNGQNNGLWLGYYSNGSKLHNCKIYNSSASGILLFNATNTLISNCIFSNNGQHGIVIDGYSNHNLIESSLAYKNGAVGIIIGHHIYDNIIRNSVADSNNWDGFQLGGYANNITIINSSSYNNRMAGFAFEAFHHDSVIINSTARNNEQGFAIVENTFNNNIMGSIAENNRLMGLGIWENSINSIIKDTDILNNPINIYLQQNVSNILFDNVIFDIDKVITKGDWPERAWTGFAVIKNNSDYIFFNRTHKIMNFEYEINSE